MSLRSDDRQWLIYDEPAVTSAIKALETLSLGIVGRSLESHPTIQIRALGALMSRISSSRLHYMMGEVEDVPDEDRHAAEAVIQVSRWLAGESVELPEQALDELHAVAFYLDRHMRGAGLSGDGWGRDLVKGNHGR